jgi:hypothetical protein
MTHSSGGAIVAEIKSSIELAMEKTRELHLSREEKEKLQEEELHSKAHILVNRFLEVDFHLKEVEKELSKCDPRQREQLEKLVLQYLTEAIQLDRDNDLIFQGIESFQEKSKSIIEKMRELIEVYRKRKQKDYQKTGRDLLTELERQGISGSAVQPKIEGSREWEEAIAKLRPTFEAQLHGLKKELGSIH